MPQWWWRRRWNILECWLHHPDPIIIQENPKYKRFDIVIQPRGHNLGCSWMLWMAKNYQVLSHKQIRFGSHCWVTGWYLLDKSSLSLWETRCPLEQNTGLEAVPLPISTAVRKITSPMKQMLREVSGVLPHYCWEVVQRRSQEPAQTLKVTETWTKKKVLPSLAVSSCSCPAIHEH